MTNRQVAFVFATAGLTMVEGFLVINSIAEGVYNCNPDPYYPETCSGQDMANLAILIGPWLVATYRLARREAITLIACLFMGLVWWLGYVAAIVLYQYVRPSPGLPAGADPFSGFWDLFLIGAMAAVLVIHVLTFVVGSAMQALIRARRRRRPKSLSEKAQWMTKGRWPVVAVLILTTMATTGIVVYSHHVEISPVGHELMAAVVVSEVDIPARTGLNKLIKRDQFRLILIPKTQSSTAPSLRSAS
jgi:hypothetical protein